MKFIILLTLLIAIITAHKTSTGSKLRHKGKDQHTAKETSGPTKREHTDVKKIIDPHGVTDKPSFAQMRAEHGSSLQSSSQYFAAPGWWGEEWFEDYDPMCQWISDDYIESLTLSCHCFGWQGLASVEGVAKNQCFFENCVAFGGNMIDCYECTEVLKFSFNHVATDGVFQLRDEYDYLLDCDAAEIVMNDPTRAEEFGYKPIWDYF